MGLIKIAPHNLSRHVYFASVFIHEAATHSLLRQRDASGMDVSRCKCICCYVHGPAIP